MQLPPIDGVSESLTEALNQTIEAYLAGNLKSLSLSALVKTPVMPDTGHAALVPIARIWGEVPLYVAAVLFENRMLEARVIDSTLMGRAQMARAEEEASRQRVTKTAPILDANGHPV